VPLPASIIACFAEKGTSDRTLDDTGAVMRLLARRDESRRAAGGVTPGDPAAARDLRGSAA
jgi:hypothetical protein